MITMQIVAALISCALLYFTINMDLFVDLMKRFDNKDGKEYLREAYDAQVDGDEGKEQ